MDIIYNVSDKLQCTNPKRLNNKEGSSGLCMHLSRKGKGIDIQVRLGADGNLNRRNPSEGRVEGERSGRDNWS